MTTGSGNPRESACACVAPAPSGGSGPRSAPSRREAPDVHRLITSRSRPNPSIRPSTPITTKPSEVMAAVPSSEFDAAEVARASPRPVGSQRLRASSRWQSVVLPRCGLPEPKPVRPGTPSRTSTSRLHGPIHCVVGGGRPARRRLIKVRRGSGLKPGATCEASLGPRRKPRRLPLLDRIHIP